MFDFPTAYLTKPVSDATLARKRKAGLCDSWGCSNPVRNAKGARRCSKCQSRLWRLNNPEKYFFNTLKGSAKKRDIPFELTFGEFITFNDRHNFLSKLDGKKGETIDRIDNDLPYRLDNIRPMPWLDNVSHRFEGLTRPEEVIAIALAAKTGIADRYEDFLEEAREILGRVEVLQAATFEPPVVEEMQEEEDAGDDNCPF